MSFQHTLYRQIIVNLKVIGSIHQNNRICCSGNNLSLRIEYDGYLQSIRRFCTGESRQTAIQSIRDVISVTIGHSKAMTGDQELIAQKKKDNDDINSYEKERYNTYTGNLKSILEKLGTALPGIHHLKTSTYKDDINVVSELDVIIEEIKDYMRVLETHITKYSVIILE